MTRKPLFALVLAALPSLALAQAPSFSSVTVTTDPVNGNQVARKSYLDSQLSKAVTVVPWAANTAYAPGALVTYGGSLYQAASAFTSGSTFNSTNWTNLVTGTAPTAYTGAIASAAPILLSDGTTITMSALVSYIQGGAVALPGTPTIALGTPTSTTIPFTITAPTSGGTPASYTITYTPAGGTAVTLSTTALTGTLSGLTAAKAYTATAAAVNSAGTGPASAAASATTAAAGAAVDDAYTVDFYGTPAASVSASSSYNGYNYGPPNSTGYFKLTNKSTGAAVPNSMTGVLYGWGPSSTTPPSAAALPPGFSAGNEANGYLTASAAGAAPFFNDAGKIAKTTGSAATPEYFWASADGGAHWSRAYTSGGALVTVTVSFP